MPFSIAGMYSRGITPPFVPSTNAKPPPAACGSTVKHDVAVLPAAARLPDEARLVLDRLADRLAVGDLRLADVRVDLELAHEAVDDDLEVQLAHPGDERLRRSRRRTTRGTTGPRSRARASAPPSFSWSAFVFGSIAIEMTGSRNCMRSRTIGWSSSQSVSPVVVSRRPDRGADVAGVDLLDLLALVRVHLERAGRRAPCDP